MDAALCLTVIQEKSERLSVPRGQMDWRGLVEALRNRSDGRSRGGGDDGWVGRKRNFGGRSLGVGVLLGAISRDVAGLATLVAGLASSVQRAAVGSSAVARNVAELAACVALHRLCLTVTSEVVRATALVAGGRSSAARKATALGESASEATAGNRSASAHVRASGIRAGASQVTRLSAVVATATSAGAAETEGRAVSLDMAQALAVVALLCLSSPWEGAAVGLVTRLLAVVAEALGGGANLGVVADVAALVAGPARKRRHSVRS